MPIPTSLGLAETILNATPMDISHGNYLPGWAKHIPTIRVPGIQDKDFKFYRP